MKQPSTTSPRQRHVKIITIELQTTATDEELERQYRALIGRRDVLHGITIRDAEVNVPEEKSV